MESVLHKLRTVGLPPQAADIGFILRKDQFRRALTLQRVVPKLMVRGSQRSFICPDCWFRFAVLHRPCVAEPECGQQMYFRSLWPSVMHRDLNQDVFRVSLRI